MSISRKLAILVGGSVAVATVALGLPARATAPGPLTSRGDVVSTIPLGGWITDKKMPSFAKPRAAWNDDVGPTVPKWTPKGKLIADTGFRPGKDGFFFFNYGNKGTSYPNRLNRYIFGTSRNNVTGMGSKQMIGLFGAPQVCRGAVSQKGTCQLTLAATHWMNASNKSGNAGHCFGMATTAGLVFDRLIRAKTLGGSTAHKVKFAPRATATIEQAQTTQTLVNQSAYTAAQAIPLLIKAMRKRSGMFTLGMQTKTDGHAITPLAIYSRGHGKYDIAVYDNNYPDRVRAIHANTKVKVTKKRAGFAYQLSPAIGGPADMMIGKINLTPVKSLLPAGNFPCPFCWQNPATNVTLSPAVTNVRASIQVTLPDGSAIPGMKTTYPTNPWEPGQLQSFPTFMFPTGVEFKVTIDNGGNPAPLSTNLQVGAGTAAGGLDVMLGGNSDYVVLPGSVDQFTLAPTTGAMSFQSSAGSDPGLLAIDANSADEVVVEVNENDVPPGGGFTSVMDQTSDTFTFKPPATDSQVDIELIRSGIAGNQVITNVGRGSLDLPPVGSLSWTYGTFTLQSTSTDVQLLDSGGVPSSTVTIATSPS